VVILASEALVLIIIEGNSNIPVAILSTDNTISTMDFEEARLPTVQEQPNTNFTHAQNQAAKNIIRLIGEELQNATSWPPVHLQNQPSRINENVQPSKKDNLETRASRSEERRVGKECRYKRSK